MVPIAVMAIFAGVLMWETFDLHTSLQRVEHTDQVLDQSRHLLKLLVDVQNGMRGYLLSGDEAVLQPYLEGKKRFDSEYRALYQLVDDNSPQKQRLEEARAGYAGVDRVHRQSYSPSPSRKSRRRSLREPAGKERNGCPSRANLGVPRLWKKDCASSAFELRTSGGHRWSLAVLAWA